MDKVYRPRPLQVDAALRRAIAIADCPEFTAIAAKLTERTGRPKAVPYRTVIIAFLLHAILGFKDMRITKVADTLCALPASMLQRLAVTTAQPAPSLRRAINKLERHMKEGLEVELPDGPCVYRIDDFTNLVQTAIPPEFRIDGDIAVDGMPYPTWARRREYVNKKTGEIWPCADPGAALAHQTSTPNHESVYYLGYELNLATYVPSRRESAASRPHLALGMTLRSGNQNRGSAGAAAVIRAARRFPATEIIADRGYTQLAITSFWLHLHEIGLRVVHDLRSQQRGTRDSAVPKVLLIDGHPFTAGIPENLRDITPPPLGATREEQQQKQDLYNRRIAYAFTPHSAIDPDTGSQRFKGPVRTGKLRCPNHPKSMRLSRSKPLSRCVRGAPCKCGAVITLKVEDDIHLRQPDLYGTTDWKHSDSRRSGIESLNAEASTHRAQLRRGFTRVHGLIKTAIMLTFAIAGLNVRILHDWYETRWLTDPWSEQLNEPPDQRPRQKLAPKKRRLTLRERIQARAGPPRPTTSQS